MALPLPNPVALLAPAAATVETALGLVPRAAAALDRVEALLDRVDRVMSRVEGVAEAAAQTNVEAAAIVTDAGRVTRRAGRAVDGVTGVTDRADVALQAWEPTLRRLAPQADRFASALSEQEVDAAIALVDKLPVVLDHVENDVIPVLTSLDRVGPDLHEVLEVVEELRRIITGLPGIGLLRRRGDEEPPPEEDGRHDRKESRRSRAGSQ